MELQNIIQSADYVEFVNKIDDLINELLYSQTSGYINLTSKEALNCANSTIEKFCYEADKIAKEYKISNSDDVINDKKNELIQLIGKHYHMQTHVWAKEVFNHTIDNCILKVSINPYNKELQDEMYSKILSALSWISAISDIPKDIQEKMLQEINSKFVKALNSNDNDYILPNNPLKSDCETYINLRSLIKTDYKTFLNINLEDYKSKLSVNDFNYFQKLKNNLLINKTKEIDEINLIDCAINKLNIKNYEDIYYFLTSITDDFTNLDKKDEDSKVKALKRRMEIFKNKDEYYMKLFGF